MLKLPKQPNQVKGNKIGCINFQMCPICFGCRAFNANDEECIICKKEGIDGTKRNFNVCNTDLHQADRVNKMVTKNKIKLDNIEIKSWEEQYE